MDFDVRVYGKYYLLDKVATGGMAEVFKAKTFGVRGFERLLVIKQILPHLTKDRDFVEMFIDEAKISVELSHANIVQVFDLGKIGSNYFIAMEYIDGKDLRSLLKKSISQKKMLPLSHAVYIAGETLKGLEYAHKKKDSKTGEPFNIVHRDVSPQNVVISYEGEVKIVDFGIAKAERRINETQAGVLKGKFGYMSPEQAMGYEVDNRSDIFSCGILLFEMLTGRRLFMGENDLETIELIREADIPPLNKYNPDVPTELEEVVYKALQRDADDRYDDARSMQLELTKFMFQQFPDFSSSDISTHLKTLFDKEMQEERLRLKQALEHIEENFKPNQSGEPSFATEKLDEVSFVHPNPSLSLTDDDSQATEREDLGGFRENRATTPASDLSSMPSMPSQPSRGSYSQPSIAHERTQYQPRESASIQRDFRDDVSQAEPSGSSRFRPWAVPFLLLLIVAGLAWYQFLRPHSQGGSSGGETATTNGAVVERAVIDLATEPVGAEVYVNDQLFGMTPVALELDANTSQTFLFRLDGYVEKSQTVFVAKGANNPLRVVLEKDISKLATLKLNSEPTGARIYLNGEETGKRTPATFEGLALGGEVAIRLYRAGYNSKEESLTLDKNLIEQSYKLSPRRARVAIETEPSGAQIFLNGRRIGSSPTSARMSMTGASTITAKLEGYEDYEQKVTPSAADDRITFLLKQKILEYGYLSINADPWATVYLDGQPLGNTPILGAKVTVGKHRIELEHSDYGKKSESVVIAKIHSEENPLLIIKDMKK